MDLRTTVRSLREKACIFGGLGCIHSAFCPYSSFTRSSHVYCFQIYSGILLWFRRKVIFQAFFGSGPFAVVGGALSDIWRPEERGASTGFFAATILSGPCLGLIVGGVICQTMSWRWTIWVHLIFAGVVMILFFFGVPETYQPKLLLKRNGQQVDGAASPGQLYRRLIVLIFRPIRMLFTESIVAGISIYIAFVYALIFSLFNGIPITFISEQGFSDSTSRLPFIAVILGLWLGLFFTPIQSRLYLRDKRASKLGTLRPEGRLYQAFAGMVYNLLIY